MCYFSILAPGHVDHCHYRLSDFLKLLVLDAPPQYWLVRSSYLYHVPLPFTSGLPVTSKAWDTVGSIYICTCATWMCMEFTSGWKTLTNTSRRLNAMVENNSHFFHLQSRQDQSFSLPWSYDYLNNILTNLVILSVSASLFHLLLLPWDYTSNKVLAYDILAHVKGNMGKYIYFYIFIFLLLYFLCICLSVY